MINDPKHFQVPSSACYQPNYLSRIDSRPTISIGVCTNIRAILPASLFDATLMTSTYDDDNDEYNKILKMLFLPLYKISNALQSYGIHHIFKRFKLFYFYIVIIIIHP